MLIGDICPNCQKIIIKLPHRKSDDSLLWYCSSPNFVFRYGPADRIGTNKEDYNDKLYAELEERQEFETIYRYLYLEGLINEFIPFVQSERKRLDVGWKEHVDLTVFTEDEHLTIAFYIFHRKIIDRCKLNVFKPSMFSDNFVEVTIKGSNSLSHKVAFEVKYV